MIQKVITYSLEMNDIKEFKPKDGFKEMFEVIKTAGDVFANWAVFVGVGLPWKWNSRLKWDIEDWNNYFRNVNSHTYLVFNKKRLVGYFELEMQNNRIVELKFFGLLPMYLNEKLGGHLLSLAIENAWNIGARRIWVHTCSNDHVSALNNYISRGFKLFKEVEEEEDVPEKSELLEMTNRFLSNYFDLYSHGRA